MVWDAEKIRELRLRLGFSTSDLARRLQIDCSDVKTWESGQSSPAQVQLQLLDLLSHQAELCADEVSAVAMSEIECSDDHLGQIDLTSVKRRFSQNN